jgi:hypothetical protein
MVARENCVPDTAGVSASSGGGSESCAISYLEAFYYVVLVSLLILQSIILLRFSFSPVRKDDVGNVNGVVSNSKS